MVGEYCSPDLNYMSEAQNLPKFCPRCGAFYRDLPSATCPQCFGRLEVMDPQQASSFDERRKSPTAEDLQVRAVEDERYKEQAFGGCAALATIAVATIIAAALIINWGIHRKLPPLPPTAQVSFDRPDTVLPSVLAGESRTHIDVNRKSPTTTFSTIRSLYGPHLQVFAAPADILPQQRDAFRISANIVLGSDAASLKHDEIEVHGVDYLIFGDTVDLVERAVNQIAQ